jgi:hypothetical protein
MWLNETYSKHLSDKFPLQKKEMLYHHCFSALLYNTIWKVQEQQVGLKLNGTHQLLVYADDVNLLGENRYHKRSAETLTDTSKEAGLEVNREKTKCMLLSCHQNAGQNHGIKIPKRSFENVAQFKYLGMTVTNQEEIKGRSNSGNAFYHSAQNFLSSCLLSKM